jgi:hypothetical protein
MSVSLIVVTDYERVNGCNDNCRRTCIELLRVRKAVWWFPWISTEGYVCRVFADELETFQEGTEMKAKRSSICVEAERQHELFDEPNSKPQVESIQQAANEYRRTARGGYVPPPAVDRPTLIKR